MRHNRIIDYLTKSHGEVYNILGDRYEHYENYALLKVDIKYRIVTLPSFNKGRFTSQMMHVTVKNEIVCVTEIGFIDFDYETDSLEKAVSMFNEMYSRHPFTPCKIIEVLTFKKGK